jgi:hypothetical protein
MTVDGSPHDGDAVPEPRRWRPFDRLAPLNRMVRRTCPTPGYRGEVPGVSTHRTPQQVDAEVCRWLREAYRHAA